MFLVYFCSYQLNPANSSMGTTKSQLFSPAQNELAQLAKALAHPARIAIVQYLCNANECINSDLVQELGLAQATVSQHLAELKEAGIIQGSIDGVRMNYCINAERWPKIKEQFNTLFSHYDPEKKSCC